LSSNGWSSYVSRLVTGKKKQPLLFAQGGRLENKISQIRSQSKWGHNEQICGELLITFRKFF